MCFLKIVNLNLYTVVIIIFFIYSECDIGLLGTTCDVPCRFPNYGKGCQFLCNCKEELCDPVYGCNCM